MSGGESGRRKETGEPGEGRRIRRFESGGLDEAGSEVGRRRERARAALEMAEGPNDLPRPLVREHVGWMRDVERHAKAAGERFGPHAAERHLDIDAEGLNTRLDCKPTMTHATAFRSAEALVMAEMSVRRHVDAMYGPAGPAGWDEGRVQCSMPAAEVLGPRWRDHVVGRSRSGKCTVDTRFPDDTRIYALWTRTAEGVWRVQTCHPTVPKKKG